MLWLPLSEGVRGFLGLGRATYNSNCLADFFATVGVRFEDAYQLAVTLGATPDSKAGISVSSPLKYLRPALPDTDYCFRRGDDNSEKAARLVSDIRSYALPFYARYSSVEAALEAIRLDGPHIGDRHIFVPIAHCYLGHDSKALSEAEEYGRGFDPRRHNGGKYHQFIENLRRRAASQT